MDVEVRRLRDEERAAAGAVAGRALAEGPMSHWIYGHDAIQRVGGNLNVFVGYTQTLPEPLGALIGEHVVGVCGATPPGTCIGAVATDEMRVLPDSVGGPGDDARMQYAWSLISVHDLDERHWHVGPVSVEPGLQGAGIGGLMMRALVDQMDAEGEVAWLETDKPENVVFYRRHGFDVAEEVTEHGLTTWWMRRDPR